MYSNNKHIAGKPTIDTMNDVIASSGDTVSMSCVFNGDGDIKAYWFFKGRTMDGMTENPVVINKCKTSPLQIMYI